MSVTVTASNGWVHKPITEADAAAFMMSFRDYPISPGETPISYEDRLTRFSESLMVNEVGTLPITSDKIDGIFRVYGLYKPDGTFVGQRTYGFFTAGEVNILNLTMHPDHRQQGYTMGISALAMGLWEHYNITIIKSRLEATPSHPGMAALKATYASHSINVDAGDHPSKPTSLDASGNTIDCKDLIATYAQGEALVASSATWKDITCVIS